MNMKKLLLAAALASGPLLAAPSAQAFPLISIGLQLGNGAINTVASGPGAASLSSMTVLGNFIVTSINGTGQPPLFFPSVMDSQTISLSSSGGGTLHVYVTTSDNGDLANGNTAPTGLQDFGSTFTENNLPAAWTVTEATYLDPQDAIYGTSDPSAILLGSTTFPPLPTGQPVTIVTRADAGAGPYSVTAEYTIVSTGQGQDNATIDVSVPEPASLSLFGAALLGLGLFARRRRRV